MGIPNSLLIYGATEEVDTYRAHLGKVGVTAFGLRVQVEPCFMP